MYADFSDWLYLIILSKIILQQIEKEYLQN